MLCASAQYLVEDQGSSHTYQSSTHGPLPDRYQPWCLPPSRRVCKTNWSSGHLVFPSQPCCKWAFSLRQTHRQRLVISSQVPQPTRNVNSRTWTWLGFPCQMDFLQNIFLSIRDGWLFAKLDIFPLRPTWLERTERANMRLWKRRKRWFWFRQPIMFRLRLKENDKCSRSRRWRRSPGGWRRPWDWFKDVRSLSDLSLGLGSSYVSINIFSWITFIPFLTVFSSHIPFPSSWWCLEKHRVNQHESHGL